MAETGWTTATCYGLFAINLTDLGMGNFSRHNDGLNGAFADSHVKWYRQTNWLD
ncbi:MAG: hypothetical protein HY318_06610 [Armatimonadetes bacterium]|nr:hypothetical protein [Armatimonadota bacterium]